MTEEQLEDVIKNWKTYCTEENFIGIGSTRKAFKAGDVVIKVHLHPVGHLQSESETNIYRAMKEKGLDPLFAAVYYTDEQISVQQYYAPLAQRENQSFEIDMKKDELLIPERYEEALRTLDGEFDSFDLKDSDNYGLNKQGKLVFIDYGMKKSLYETEWVPLAESGILPQIDFDF